VEIHFDRLDCELRARPLGLYAQGDPFVGLDADHKDVRIHARLLGVEEHAGGVLKLDGDFRTVSGHALSDSHVNRNTVPAPVVDERPVGHERLRFRLRVDPVFSPVSRHFLAPGGAGGVLGAHDILHNLLGRVLAEGPHDLELFVSDAVGTEVRRRLHCDEA